MRSPAAGCDAVGQRPTGGEHGTRRERWQGPAAVSTKPRRPGVPKDAPKLVSDACSDQRLGAMLLEVVQRRQQIEDTKAAVNDPLEALLVTPPAWDLEQ